MRADDLSRLRDFMQDICIMQGEFTLASGLAAKYYYDGKKATLHPEMAQIIGRVVLSLIRGFDAEAVGGMSIGADPIATSVAFASLDDGGPSIPAFIVRKEAKEHGTKEQTSAGASADGQPLLQRGRKVAIVDDVITTGGSIQGAIDVVKALGCEVALVVALVERHEHGGAMLEAKGYNFRRLFYTNEEGNLFIDEQLRQPNTTLAGGRVLR